MTKRDIYKRAISSEPRSSANIRPSLIAELESAGYTILSKQTQTSLLIQRADARPQRIILDAENTRG